MTKPRFKPPQMIVQTFDRLLALAQRDHHEGQTPTERGPRRAQPWTAADLVAQEALYEIQHDLLDLMLGLARFLGPEYVERLVTTMPWAFKLEDRSHG